MSLAYTLSGSAFTDSVHGTAGAATAMQTLVPQIVDRRYHKQVLDKSFFTRAGIIGPDAYREGGVSGTAPGYAVIMKTDLNKEPGDVIKMGLLEKLDDDYKDTGKVLNLQLVDNETTNDFSYLKVSIERLRQGVYGFGGMTTQRNPYGGTLKPVQEESLRDWAASIVDSSLLYALWCGYSPHLLRAWGVSKCDPTGVSNTLYGNDVTLDTTRTIANLTDSEADNISAKTFEVSLAYCEQNNIDPANYGGGQFYIALISPKAKLVLLQDTRFRDAMKDARERSITNPLFQHVDFVYNNHVIVTYDKIRSILAGKNPDGTITITSNAIAAEADYTGIGGGHAATDLHQMLVLGANAVAHADVSMKVVDRKEDDYGNVIGSGIDMIFGSRRADWLDDSSNALNQSSVRIVTVAKA